MYASMHDKNVSPLTKTWVDEEFALQRASHFSLPYVAVHTCSHTTQSTYVMRNSRDRVHKSREFAISACKAGRVSSTYVPTPSRALPQIRIARNQSSYVYLLVHVAFPLTFLSVEA